MGFGEAEATNCGKNSLGFIFADGTEFCLEVSAGFSMLVRRFSVVAGGLDASGPDTLLPIRQDKQKTKPFYMCGLNKRLLYIDRLVF